MSLLFALLSTLACDRADDLVTDEPYLATVDDLRAVWEAGCTPEAIAALPAAEPASIRAALLALDAELELETWDTGFTYGLPAPEVERLTPLLAATALSYTLYVPPEYDPAEPLGLYLNPGHPVDSLEDDFWFEWYATAGPEPVFALQDNFYNTLYYGLGEDAYYDQVFYHDDFDLVAAHQDHEVVLQAILAEILRSYAIDPDRITMGGVSAEGNASWNHGILSSDLWAAMLPISSGQTRIHEDFWRNLENVSVLVVHGTEDDLCAVEDMDEVVDTLTGWGHDVDYWREEGEGHGTMVYDEFPDMAAWLAERERQLLPERVHKAVFSPRDLDAHWLAVEPDGALSEEVLAHAVPPAAVADATWVDGVVTLETEGVAAVGLRWVDGPSGPGSGALWETVEVVANGASLGSFELEEDETLAVEAWCRTGDVTRAWAGQTRVEIP